MLAQRDDCVGASVRRRRVRRAVPCGKVKDGSAGSLTRDELAAVFEARAMEVKQLRRAGPERGPASSAAWSPRCCRIWGQASRAQSKSTYFNVFFNILTAPEVKEEAHW